MLAALGEQLDALLDVTIVYPGDKAPGFWDLLSGAVPKVIIDIQVRELDPALCKGDYENDPAVRQAVQDWVNQLWHAKDQRIETLKAALDQSRASPRAQA
ncbi:putative acyltransferase YihG [compost metagenome]